MKGLFNLDNPVMRFLGKTADLMILNFLAMVCCIPIVTIGASLTALHYMALKILRDEESYIMKSFFRCFKQNFKQATGIWLIFLSIFLIMSADYYVIEKSLVDFPGWLIWAIFIIGVLVIFTFLYVFPILAKFDNTVKKTIKNAFLMSIFQFPKTILMFIIYMVPIVIFLLIPELLPLVFMFGLSLPALLCALLYNKFFKKLENQVIAATAPQEPEEDERIFKDELDETLINDQKVNK